MLGLMQHYPLLVSSLLEFARTQHRDTPIISRRVEGDIHRSDYSQVANRACQAAHALDAWNIPAGSRVATLAWNGYRHFELYYGVSGSGRVLHTINPRLHPEQMAWICNHAEDEVLCFDLSFLPLVQALQSKVPSIRHYVALCDADKLPVDSGIPNLVSYEQWIAGHPTVYAWPQLDENTASSLCYTSGTTGNPKGVLYSHRSSVLHAMAIAMPDAMGLGAQQVVLAVVPMFHVNAWGLPYAAALTGFTLVFPGAALDGKSVYELMEAEQVTMAAGVPTVWQMLLGYVQSQGLRFNTLRSTVVGGSACPPAMLRTFAQDYGVDVRHAWGMTETSPVGTVNTLKRKHMGLDVQAQHALRIKQGRGVFGVDIEIVDGHGQPLPHDGKTPGDLLVRGAWVMKDYYRSDNPSPLQDGWFPSGDVATIDADGYLQITDRSKDVIKSGGEWISSIDVENIAMAHPAVAMAACIGVPHPKWDERPIVVVVKKPGMALETADLLAFYQGKMSKWQIPDDVVFVDSIPLGGTGKMQKNKLRDVLKDYQLPSAQTV
ncbi:long-chain-fatty-acid--CoA ligase [Curvibacter sp. CHRR-16]|uniref:3-(methylthio)propionyl-CoA ligase n=1 Tax=Curvibacter sp. CHRR-16 TaxID=2835872 RepID=UPI001BDA1665|nr:3-(methylthio)propionyl-CoA ligase [Curvibacter sp. CHRR-16]MBT0571515.1 long-chain-fatty-acid--CoA ligase [Curvibacter sp. CHRR-16]